MVTQPRSKLAYMPTDDTHDLGRMGIAIRVSFPADASLHAMHASD